MVYPCVVRLLTLAFCFSVASLSASAQTVEKLGSLPLNSTPGRVLLQGADGYLYGLLLNTGYSRELGTVVGKKCGAVYRLSPDGEVKYLRKFDNPGEFASANSTGFLPSEPFCFGADGCLYGFTSSGGLHGKGVFYRLTTDGEYRVITHIKGNDQWDFNPRFFGGLVQKADGYFYTVDNSTHHMARFGLDGTHEQFGAYIGGFGVVKPDPVNDANLLVCWTDSRSPNRNQITIRTIRCADGEAISDRLLQPYAADASNPAAVFVTQTEVIVVAQSKGKQDDGSQAPGQIISINPNNEVTVLAEMPWIPYFVEGTPAMQLIMANDGSFYFSAGEQTRGDIGVQGGSRIYHLERNGTITQMCDFDGYPLLAMCEGRDGVIYGASWGPNIEFDSGEPEAPVVARALAKAVRTTAAAPRDPARVKHGAFRLVPAGVTPNLAPVTGVDVARLGPAISGVTQPVRIRSLLNDRDPERKPLTLTQVSEPAYGTVTTETGATGQAEVIYTPNITPSRSEILHYTVADEGGETSQGAIKISGDVAGRYRTPGFKPKLDNSLQFSIARTGKFSVVGKAGGVRISGVGSLDFNDRGRIDRVLRDGTSWTLEFELQNADSTSKTANYRLKVGDQEIVGAATR